MQPLYIVGATGSGKSAIAVELALRCGGEIVNADAFQLYRGMDILTAMPRGADRARVRHHLYGVIDARETYNAASYAKLAKSCIAEIAGRGVMPIVVGGSGLYVKALTHGLSPLPPADAAFRGRLRELSMEQQVAWLRKVDPAGAAKMDLQNPRHIERALEISVLSGQPASELKAAWARSSPTFRGVLIEWERRQLCDRINARVLAMAEAGLVAEVAALSAFLETAGKAIGVREVRAYLARERTLPEALAAMQQATRRYAKRQCTWFRREKGFQSVCLKEGADGKSAVESILALFPELLLT